MPQPALVQVEPLAHQPVVARHTQDQVRLFAGFIQRPDNRAGLDVVAVEHVDLRCQLMHLSDEIAVLLADVEARRELGPAAAGIG